MAFAYAFSSRLTSSGWQQPVRVVGSQLLSKSVRGKAGLAARHSESLVEKIPRSRRYRLLPEGYRICVVHVKLFEKIYAPLTAGLWDPFAGDTAVNLESGKKVLAAPRITD